MIIEPLGLFQLFVRLILTIPTTSLMSTTMVIGTTTMRTTLMGVSPDFYKKIEQVK